MRQLGPIVLTLLFVTCGSASQPAASSAPAPASPSATLAAVATPIPTYPPTAEGFSSTVLTEKPRILSTSVTAFVRIVGAATTDAIGVPAQVPGHGSFTASYQAAVDRPATGAPVAYATPDLPPLPVGRYTESLTLVVVQPGGRSAAHMHSGIEGVLVLDGRVLVRSGGNPPTFLAPGEGFYILPKVPVQLINAGDVEARTLVYSISPEGVPSSTKLDQSP